MSRHYNTPQFTFLLYFFHRGGVGYNIFQRGGAGNFTFFLREGVGNNELSSSILISILFYTIQVFENGCLAYYLDGNDEETSSWMRYIRCARHKGEQNTSVMQYFGNIYYRVYKEIQPGHEILVWYDETCPHFLGIPLKMQDIGSSTVSNGKTCYNKQLLLFMRGSCVLLSFSELTGFYSISNLLV